MPTLKRDADGEPLVYWHWQELNEQRRHWLHRRAWLHWPRKGRAGMSNSFGVEVVAPSKRVGATLTFEDSTCGGDAVSGHIDLWLVTVYAHLEIANWTRRLPGVRWHSGDWRSGKRELRLALFRDDAPCIGWTVWANPDSWSSTDPAWKRGTRSLVDLVFGQPRTSQYDLDSGRTVVPMPEGAYPAAWTRTRYTTRWRRWRKPRVWHRWTIEIDAEGGIPHPGKGENSWDCEDDGLQSMSCGAQTPTLEAAVEAVQQTVLRYRLKYGGPDWKPATPKEPQP